MSEMTKSQMEARIKELEAEVAEKDRKARITVKTSSEKGVLCFYGLNVRRPVSMYAGQFVRFLSQLNDFMPQVVECSKTASYRDEKEKRASIAFFTAYNDTLNGEKGQS